MKSEDSEVCAFALELRNLLAKFNATINTTESFDFNGKHLHDVTFFSLHDINVDVYPSSYSSICVGDIDKFLENNYGNNK